MSKVAVVTGGNKGIGLAVTGALVALGYHVVVIARTYGDDALLQSSQVTQKAFDLTQIELIPQLVSEIGHIDVLVNNAGLMYAIPFDDYPQDKLDKIIKLNIEAPVALIREVSKSMVKKGEGRIVNNASIAGQIGHPDVWYGITKAGLINATKSFAKLLGGDGIVINAVAPGPVETEMLETIPEARKTAIKGQVYSGRFATAEEVAKAIVWLATDCPDYINGTCIDVNNGAFPR